MSWGDIMDKVFAWLFIIAIIWVIIGIISELATSDWRRRMVEWQEGRIRDLEQDNRNLESDLRWVNIDLRFYRDRVAMADERADRLAREVDSIYRLLAQRENNEGGAPAQQVAA